MKNLRAFSPQTSQSHIQASCADGGGGGNQWLTIGTIMTESASSALSELCLLCSAYKHINTQRERLPTSSRRESLEKRKQGRKQRSSKGQGTHPSPSHVCKLFSLSRTHTL